MSVVKKVVRAVRGIPADLAYTLHMKPIQGLIWFTCWSCWTLGSLQYYLLPFTLAKLASYLDVKQTKISEANTVSMLTRSIGALIFGIASDQYGRKFPMLVDLVLLGVFTLCSGFIHTYGQLIGVRLLFGMYLVLLLSNSLILLSGIAYGGVYGMMMATLLESLPRKARGIAAGLTQQGFAAGYLLASGFHLAMSKQQRSMSLLER